MEQQRRSTRVRRLSERTRQENQQSPISQASPATSTSSKKSNRGRKKKTLSPANEEAAPIPAPHGIQRSTKIPNQSMPSQPMSRQNFSHTNGRIPIPNKKVTIRKTVAPNGRGPHVDIDIHSKVCRCGHECDTLQILKAVLEELSNIKMLNQAQYRINSKPFPAPVVETMMDSDHAVKVEDDRKSICIPGNYVFKDILSLEAHHTGSKEPHIIVMETLKADYFQNGDAAHIPEETVLKIPLADVLQKLVEVRIHNRQEIRTVIYQTRISYPYQPNHYQSNYYHQQQPIRQNQSIRQRTPLLPQPPQPHQQHQTINQHSLKQPIESSRKYRVLLKGIIEFVSLTFQAPIPNLTDKVLAEKSEFEKSIKNELNSIKEKIIHEEKSPNQALAFKNCQEIVDNFVLKNYRDNLFLLAKFSDTSTLRITYVSSRIKDVIGHNSSDMMGLTLYDFIDHDSSVKLQNFKNESHSESLNSSFQFRTKNVEYITAENRYLFPEEFTCGQMYRMKVFAKKLHIPENNENHIFMAFELKSRPWWSDTKQYKIGHFVCYCYDEEPFIPFLLDLDNVTVDKNDQVKKEEGACFSETFKDDYKELKELCIKEFYTFHKPALINQLYKDASDEQRRSGCFLCKSEIQNFEMNQTGTLVHTRLTLEKINVTKGFKNFFENRHLESKLHREPFQLKSEIGTTIIKSTYQVIRQIPGKWRPSSKLPIDGSRQQVSSLQPSPGYGNPMVPDSMVYNPRSRLPEKAPKEEGSQPNLIAKSPKTGLITPSPQSKEQKARERLQQLYNMKQTIKNSAQKRSYEQVAAQQQSTPLSSSQVSTMASPKMSKILLPSPTQPDDFSSPLNIQHSGMFSENGNYGPSCDSSNDKNDINTVTMGPPLNEQVDIFTTDTSLNFFEENSDAASTSFFNMDNLNNIDGDLEVLDQFSLGDHDPRSNSDSKLKLT